MANLSKEICIRFRDARRERGLTQSALAAEIGCKQSALSMFESGQSSKLSEEFVSKLSQKLGVSLEVKDKNTVDVFSGVVSGYCPSCFCPSNIPYVVDDRVFLRPIHSVHRGGRCAYCGEILERACPVCGAPLNEGACCAVCGSAYVTVSLPGGADLVEWAAARRREISELNALSRRGM